MTNLIKQKTSTVVLHRTTNFVMLAFVIGCVFCYMYFANATVRTVTLLQKTRGEIQSLSVKVSEMEATRLSVDDKVSVKMAKSLGFVEASDQIFIVNKSQKTALSLKVE